MTDGLPPRNREAKAGGSSQPGVQKPTDGSARATPSSPASRTRRALKALRLLPILAISGAAGWVLEGLGGPLPWMIGPLLITAALAIWGRFDVSVPVSIRPIGQMIVATQVGLAFSAGAVGLLVDLAPVIVGTALATGACVFAVALLMARFSQLSLSQAFLSGVPTSPVEAAAMAAKAGLDPMPVIFSQTLRLATIVVVVPFALYALEGWPDAQRPRVHIAAFDLQGVALLLAIGGAAMILFRLLRIPNPNFLGPLAVIAAVQATGHAPAEMPPMVLAMAQVVLGTWLGAVFRRELLTSAGRLTLVCGASIVLVLALCSASAVGIAWIAGMDWRTLVLGAAPGSVAEMVLTAKFLGQNVLLITTFHLVRIFIFMPNIPWIVALIIRYENRSEGKQT